MDEIEDLKNEIMAKLVRLENLAALASPFWSAKTLSLATGWSMSTIYAKVARNEIPYYKPSGKNLYFVPSEIQQYILNNKVRSNEEIKQLIEDGNVNNL